MTGSTKTRSRSFGLLHPAVGLIAGLLLVGCSSSPPTSVNQASAQVGAASGSPAATDAGNQNAASSPPTARPAATPSFFTSKLYGYSIGLPAGWLSASATVRWDGVSGTKSDSPNVDSWKSAGTTAAWGSAAAYAKDLASYAAKAIADTAKYHGDTCTAPPEAQEAITVGGEPGGEPGTLLAFDCGILINIGVTVHDGIGYTFGFRDPAVQAAMDPADHAIFIDLLKSLRFPG